MKNSDDAYWLLEALGSLRSPEVNLVRELLGHLRELKDEQTEEMFSGSEDASRGKEKQKQRLELQRRAALYSKLREAWQQVKDFPVCLRQCQLLKVTSHLRTETALTIDPLDEEENAVLDLEKAREYGRRALEIAQQLGDLAETGDVCTTLAIHYKLHTDYGKALDYCEKAFAAGKQIGNLYLQSRSCKIKYEILTLMPASLDELIQCLKELMAVLQQQGDIAYLISNNSQLAKLLILSNNTEEAEEELEKIHALIQRIADKYEVPNALAYYYYYRNRSLLNYKQGNIETAISAQKQAMLINLQSQEFREDFLWADLSWLEMICKKAGKGDGFRHFCKRLNSGLPKLEQWYLIEDKPEDTAWDEEEYFDKGSLSSQWHWVDPLQKGFYRLENGLEIAPVMGAGFYSNVYAPRMMREIEGDFVIEAVLDYCNGFTKAGGILVYQDDNTLIRFGVGIQFDGEITLTVKSPEQGFFIIARGLAEAENLHLRLERNGDCFRAWCGDGTEWFKCGQAEVKMEEKIEAGLFAECTYRHFDLVRCRAEEVRFREVSIKENL